MHTVSQHMLPQKHSPVPSACDGYEILSLKRSWFHCMAVVRNSPGAGHLLSEKLASTECRAFFELKFPAEAAHLPGLGIVFRDRQKIGLP